MTFLPELITSSHSPNCPCALYDWVIKGYIERLTCRNHSKSGQFERKIIRER